VRSALESLLGAYPIADTEKILAASRRSTTDAPWPTVRAMARAAEDPHTVLVEPAAGMQMQLLVTGQSVNVPGFTMHRSKGRMIVGEVVASSPAEQAGLRAGDVVVSIDDLETSRGFEDLMHLMGRPAGSSAPLAIIREGVKRVLELRVATWVVPLVDARVLPAGQGYVRARYVTTSAEPERDVAASIRRALEDFAARGVSKVVLDLRSNPGGYGVGRVASVLVPESPLAVYRDRSGGEEATDRTGPPAPLPDAMVVLVDDQTLSSAEMITLALQDYGAARVVGQPTAGGLTVPRYVPLADGYMLMVPDRVALAPRSRALPDGRRVHPDRVVPNRGPEDFAAGRDAQLEAALDLLSS
jgi:carboxyl-terminal processing protease